MSEVKYIIKAYDYDGKFYGYFAPHPDDPENKSFSYYVDERKDAKRFETYAEADNTIERFQNGSNLEYIIIQDTSEYIKNWIKENYGASEAENPSWDIDALASAIEKFINK